MASAKTLAPDRLDPRLRDWIGRFERSPLARDVVTQLEGRAQEIWRETFELLRSQSPEYRNAVDDDFTAESKNHCGELLETIVRIAAGRRLHSDPFAFVRRHAEWRARHQVPLVASLHAYRLAHKTYWGITRELLARHRRQKEALRAVAMLSDFWIELFEAVGAVLEEAHAAEAARIFAQNTNAHARLIDNLLAGVEPAGMEERQLLALCGIRAGMKLTVGVFRQLPVSDGRPVDSEVALRSLVRLLNQVLPSSQFGKLVGLGANEIVLIAGCNGPAAQALAVHLTRHGFSRKSSVGASAGFGLDKDEITQLPEAATEARLAADFTDPSRLLLRFAELDLAELVLHRVDKAVLRLIPDWIRRAYEADTEQELFRTIRAFARCSLNVKETARQLDVHTNTVYFRLNQIKARTGVDPRTFEGMTLLVTSLRLLDRYGPRLR